MCVKGMQLHDKISSCDTKSRYKTQESSLLLHIIYQATTTSALYTPSSQPPGTPDTQPAPPYHSPPNPKSPKPNQQLRHKVQHQQPTLHPSRITNIPTMCETYIVEYTCGCTDVKFLYTCKPHCVGSSMIRHKDARLRAQACDMHGGPYDSPSEYAYKK